MIVPPPPPPPDEPPEDPPEEPPDDEPLEPLLEELELPLELDELPDPALELPDPALEPPLELDVEGVEDDEDEVAGAGLGFGLARVGRLEVDGGAVTAGADPEDWFRLSGTAVPPALFAVFELEIASAAANSAARSATSSPRRAGAGSVNDMRSSAFWNQAPCRRSSC
jgi:hypothetical protein